MRKYLLAGLGNIGPKYEGTRHNIGFDLADQIAREQGVSFEMKRLAFYTSFSLKGRRVSLIKPTTLMNLSGNAIRYWLHELKVEPCNLLVLVDELALPIGRVKLNKKGSNGGHNGLRDIEDKIKTRDYPRLRIGIGNDFPKGRQIDYVLGSWTEDQKAAMNLVVDRCEQSCYDFVLQGVERAMTNTNRKS